MRKNLIKALCVIIAVMMLAGLSDGCGSKQQTPANESDSQQTTVNASNETTQAASSSTAAGNSTGDLEWKSDTSPITFSAFMDAPSSVPFKWGQDEVSGEITKRTGVTVDIKRATTTDSTQLSTLLASGELPDFIITGSAPMRTTLWKQGFAQPLNQLIDKYCPNMWGIIPKGEKGVYTENDGNLYLLAAWYYDIETIAKIPGVGMVFPSFNIDRPMYEAIGKPPMKTLDDYKAVLLKIKEKYPDMKFPAYDSSTTQPDSPDNMAQTINRIFGGKDLLAINEDDTVHMNFRDEPYLKAVKYINGLFRDKLFNPENFTIKATSDQEKEIIKNQKIFSYWGETWYITANSDASAAGPYDPFEPPQEPNIPLKLRNGLYNIGSGYTFITSKCKNPERAIKYLEYSVSKEGQMLMGWGVEGKDYTWEKDSAKMSDYSANLWNKDQTKYYTELGMYADSAWLIDGWTNWAGIYWQNIQTPKLGMQSGIYNKYADNDPYQSYLVLPSDSKEYVKLNQIKELWTTSLPRMYLAKSEEECAANYKDFISKAEKLGLADVEKAYTGLYGIWKKKLEGK